MIVGNYNITNDDMNWILSDIITKGENAKNPGDTYTTNGRYYSSFEALCEAFKETVLKRAFVESDELYEVYDEFNDVLELVKLAKDNA